jgi:hypothetical protein
VTLSHHHVTVNPPTLPPLTTTCDVTGHVGLGRVAELGRGDRAQAGLALSADGRRR